MPKMNKKQKEQMKNWAIVVLLLLLFVSLMGAFKGDDHLTREILRDYHDKEHKIYNQGNGMK